MSCNVTYMPKLCRWIFRCSYGRYLYEFDLYAEIVPWIFWCSYGRYLYELALFQEVLCASHCMAAQWLAQKLLLSILFNTDCRNQTAAMGYVLF